jgi:hypothetical protein
MAGAAAVSGDGGGDSGRSECGRGVVLQVVAATAVSVVSFRSYYRSHLEICTG